MSSSRGETKAQQEGYSDPAGGFSPTASTWFSAVGMLSNSEASWTRPPPLPPADEASPLVVVSAGGRRKAMQ